LVEINLSVSVSGDPKVGKSHFALTAPEPIVVYSFDWRGVDPLIKKPMFKDKDITVKKFVPPVSDSLHPEPYAEKLWDNIREDYRALQEEAKVNTIILDPSTVLWEIIRNSWEEEKGRRQLMSRDYGEPNARMAWMLMSPLPLGINVISIQYLRERYVADKPTGELELDGFKRTEGLVDVVLDVALIGNKSVFSIKRNRFDRSLNGEKLNDATFSDVVALVSG